MFYWLPRRSKLLLVPQNPRDLRVRPLLRRVHKRLGVCFLVSCFGREHRQDTLLERLSVWGFLLQTPLHPLRTFDATDLYNLEGFSLETPQGGTACFQVKWNQTS